MNENRSGLLSFIICSVLMAILFVIYLVAKDWSYSEFILVIMLAIALGWMTFNTNN